MIELLEAGYTATEVTRLTGSTPSQVRDAQRVLGHKAHANGAGTVPVDDLLGEISILLSLGRPRQWVARELDLPDEAVNSAARYLGVEGRSLRGWSLKTYDWIESLLQDGLTPAQAARVVRATAPSVKAWFPDGKPLGITRGSHLEPHDWLEVEVLAMKGMKVPEIAEHLDMPVTVVRVALVDIGYPAGVLER